ncbi:MAG: glycosyltransferase family 2 protein [Oligoflexia bacterium]|nr:glycosyltransferase family 2 protein [Oligoflexia bacterium]
MDVSICIPVFNEKNAVRKTVLEAQNEMSKLNYKYEIIVVDDSSTDNSINEIIDLDIRIIRHKINLGGGVARVTAIRFASGKVVLQTDADGTYPTSCFKEILEKAMINDLVIGARIRESATDWHYLRVFIKWTLKTFASILSGQKIPDLNSGLRAYKRDLGLKYEYLYPRGHSIMSTMTLAFLTEGRSVDFVPIEYNIRIGKSSFHPIKDTYNYFLTIVRTTMMFNPLRICIPPAMFFLFFASFFLIRNLFYKNYQNLPYLLLFISILFFVLGVFSDQLSRISKQIAKLTNQYLADESVVEIVKN